MTVTEMEIIKLGVIILVVAAAALVGVITGAWIMSAEKRAKRRNEFLKQQVRDFYSPIMTCREEIRIAQDTLSENQDRQSFFAKKIMPYYQDMFLCFRDNMWLVEQFMRRYFADIMRFMLLAQRVAEGEGSEEDLHKAYKGEEVLAEWYNELDSHYSRLQTKLKS